MKLHIGIKGRGVITIIANDYKEIISGISKVMSYFDGKVILATANDENGEIVITEDMNRVLSLIVTDYFGEIDDFHLFDNETWDDAYKNALAMREPCKNCYR